MADPRVPFFLESPRRRWPGHGLEVLDADVIATPSLGCARTRSPGGRGGSDLCQP